MAEWREDYPFESDDVHWFHSGVVLTYLSFIDSVNRKDKVMPVSDSVLKQKYPKDFQIFENEKIRFKNIESTKYFDVSYSNSKLQVSYKDKPLIIYQKARIEDGDIFWKCKFVTKKLENQVLELNRGYVFINIGGEDCRKDPAAVPVNYNFK